MKMNLDKKYIVIYLLLFEKLWNAADLGGYLSVTEARVRIGKAHNIPKPLRQIILKEMQHHGLLEFENRSRIKLNGKPMNLLENPQICYKVAGII